MRNISMPNQTRLFSDKKVHSDDYINADTFDITQTDFDYIILAKNDIEFEKMKATLDKYMYLSNEYMVNEYAAKHITATIYMKKDIELDGRTLYAGQKGFLIDGEGMSGQIKMSILFRDSWKHISLADKALLQSYKHAYKVQEIVLQNGLAETMYDVLDEIEVDRHFEIVQAIKKRLLDHPLTKKEENMFQLYKTADAYLNAIKYVENQEEIKLEDYLDLSVIPADSDNTPDPQKELQLREDFMENVSKIEKRMEQTQEKTSEENILLSSPPDRLALANKLDIDPRDSSAILTLEPFTAEQAKPFMRAGLPFCHVGLVKDGNEVPYTKDSIDTNAAVYLIPTTLDTIDQDLSIFKNDYFVINPMEMSIKEVRTMKFLFHAMENWEEIQLPDNFVSNLLSDYANSNKKLSIEDITNLRETCFSPKTMAQAGINHDYTMPELVEILYPANTRLSAHKQERIDQQIQFNQQLKEVADFSEQVEETLAGTMNRYNDIKVCDTPPILLDIGCEQLPMLYSQKHLRKAIRPQNDRTHDHGLSVEQIKKLPELLADPVMIFDSATRNDSIVMVTWETDVEKNPIIISVHPNGTGTYQLTQVNSNYITSVYGKNNFSSFIDRVLEDHRMLYCNKEKSQELFSVLRLQLPQGFNNLNFNIIIRQSENIVKENEKTVTEILQEVAGAEELPLNDNQQMDFSEQVDAVINRTYPFYSSLKICDTPQILLDIGCDQLPMLYTQRHLRDAIRPKNPDKGHHGLTVDQIKAMPELLANPVMVFDSLSRDDSIVVMTTEVDEDLSPVIATIRPNGQGRYIVDTNIISNYVTSIYGRDNFPSHFEQLIANNKILYCNKEKSQELFERWGLQLPELTNNLNFDIIIRQSKNIVKENEKTVSETLQETAGTEELATTITPDQITEILQSHEEHISSLLQNGKPTIIINAYAGAGAGKTTSCLDICAGLKKAGYSAEYVQEYAKELVYDGSNLLDGTAAHQFEILQEQLKRQDRFVGKVDFIVTDSPILLNRIYNKELTSEYSNMLTQLQNQYETAGAKNFNFFVNRDQRPDHYEQGGRLQTFDESVKIDKEVKDMLRESVPYYGNYGHDTVNKVIANAIKTREKHIATQNKKNNQAELKEPQKIKTKQSIPHKHFYTREESQVMVQYLKENISIADIISQYEPLTKGSLNRYFKGANHDSLVVDTQRGKNCFYWNSIGAKGSVIDALMTPELGNMTKTEALNYLYDLVGGEEAVYEACFGTRTETTPRHNKITYTPKTPLVSIETTTPEPGNVVLPPKGNTRKNVYAYLNKTRMIHKDVINEFFNREMLYQDDHRNCVFVAYDKENKVNFAMRRGTSTYKRFVGDCKGNDYSHGFYVDNGAKELFVGEGVIDIMSKMSLLAEKGIDYHKYNYLAMTGTQKQEPLENILTTYPENKKVTLGLDNDKGGKEALDQIMESLKTSGIECLIDMPFPSGQDWNDYLKDYMTDKQSLSKTPKQKVSKERLEPGNDFKKVDERTPFDKKEEMNPIKASAMTKQNHFAPTPETEIDQ